MAISLSRASDSHKSASSCSLSLTSRSMTAHRRVFPVRSANSRSCVSHSRLSRTVIFCERRRSVPAVTDLALRAPAGKANAPALPFCGVHREREPSELTSGAAAKIPADVLHRHTRSSGHFLQGLVHAGQVECLGIKAFADHFPRILMLFIIRIPERCQQVGIVVGATAVVRRAGLVTRSTRFFPTFVTPRHGRRITPQADNSAIARPRRGVTGCPDSFS